KYTMAYGKMFTAGDDRGSRSVAVLGAAIPDNLGVPAATLVGQNVRIGGFLFQVLGVLASKGNSGGFGNPDDQVLIPLTTAQFRVFGSDRLRQIGVLAETEAEIPNAMAAIQRTLRRVHRLRVGVPDDFQIRNQAGQVRELQHLGGAVVDSAGVFLLGVRGDTVRGLAGEESCRLGSDTVAAVRIEELSRRAVDLAAHRSPQN